jgi:hypothetical protein
MRIALLSVVAAAAMLALPAQAQLAAREGQFAVSTLAQPAPREHQTQPEPQPEYLSWARPGPYRSPSWTDFRVTTFRSDQPIVGTYFFYWYDAQFLGGRVDRYPFHPVDQETQSFHDSRWYLKQFNDMLDAGIDFVLPDYWGEPGQHNRRVAPAPELNLFATQGLAPMVDALSQLDAAGRPLKVALFLDTTILNDEDLTTDRGKQIFYASIRDYYSKIPPRLWAAIDGRPIVWIYDAQRVSAFDQSTFDYVYEQFARDFGGLRPWIIREWQWYSAKNVGHDAVIQTEGLYSWGAAPWGFNVDTRFTVAQVGPGFSNSRLGGSNPIDTDRRGGAYYEDQLQQALRSGRKILAIETWNELGEGSGILETIEYGRQYIDLTRRYVDEFKRSL